MPTKRPLLQRSINLPLSQATSSMRIMAMKRFFVPLAPLSMPFNATVVQTFRVFLLLHSLRRVLLVVLSQILPPLSLLLSPLLPLLRLGYLPRQWVLRPPSLQLRSLTLGSNHLLLSKLCDLVELTSPLPSSKKNLKTVRQVRSDAVSLQAPVAKGKLSSY